MYSTTHTLPPLWEMDQGRGQVAVTSQPCTCPAHWSSTAVCGSENNSQRSHHYSWPFTAKSSPSYPKGPKNSKKAQMYQKICKYLTKKGLEKVVVVWTVFRLFEQSASQRGASPDSPDCPSTGLWPLFAWGRTPQNWWIVRSTMPAKYCSLEESVDRCVQCGAVKVLALIFI